MNFKSKRNQGRIIERYNFPHRITKIHQDESEKSKSGEIGNFFERAENSDSTRKSTEFSRSGLGGIFR